MVSVQTGSLQATETLGPVCGFSLTVKTLETILTKIHTSLPKPEENMLIAPVYCQDMIFCYNSCNNVTVFNTWKSSHFLRGGGII